MKTVTIPAQEISLYDLIRIPNKARRERVIYYELYQTEIAGGVKIITKGGSVLKFPYHTLIPVGREE